MEVGETWKYIGNYTVTPGDISSDGNGTGLIHNTAIVDSDQLESQSNSTNDSIDVPIGTTPNPCIDIEKYVWNGTAWLDADAATGPCISSAGTPGPGPSLECIPVVNFKIVVTNTGNVPLTGINVTDDKHGKVTLCTNSLDVNDSTEAIYNMTWACGQQVNTATATGFYEQCLQPDSIAPSNQCEKIQCNDTDKAYYYGKAAAKPSIDVQKYVYDGCKWLDADSAAAGPTLSSSTVQFKIVVKNTGAVKLTGVTLTDSKKGKLSLKTTTLNPGASTYVTYTMTKVCGQQVNTATACGIYSGKKYTDTDKAYYYGKTPVKVSIDIEKYVYDGHNWIDADSAAAGPTLSSSTVKFKIIVKNTGTVKLTGVCVTDSKKGKISLPTTTLNAGASTYVTYSMTKSLWLAVKHCYCLRHLQQQEVH